MTKQKSIMYLDKNIIADFRNVLNSSPIFYAEEEFKSNWNFICAMMDRVDSSVNYINSFNISHFDTEESLINFLTYCCIINDSIVELFTSIKPLNEFYKSKIKEQSKYFKNDFDRFMNLYNKNADKTICSDDKFFEFIRSISFAHPLDTSRAKFIKQNDKLFSPFVFVNNLFHYEIKNPIGIAIYTLIDDETIYFWFSADNVINYIRNKYKLFEKATKWFTGQIVKYSNKWSETKVNRNLSDIEILNNIKNILNERYCDSYYIDETIKLLKCVPSDIRNKGNVTKYKNALLRAFPGLYDWIDSLQNEDLYPTEFFHLLDPTPKVLYPQADYELSKIFSYLNDEIIDYKSYINNRNIYIKTNGDIDVCNFEWGLIQAERFFKTLGNKYIKFDLSNINSATEIRLLTRTALFMEDQKQNKGHVSRCIMKLITESKNKKIKVLKKIKQKTPNGEIGINIVDASYSNGNKK